MKTRMPAISLRGATRSAQTGATLVVGLVLLLVLTVLGVSGMNTATMEITMAGNTQFQQDAFQMAEDGIDVAIAQRNFNTLAPSVVAWVNNPAYDRQSVTTFQMNTPVPDLGFSMGVSTGSVQAFHFDVISVGRATRNATATHNQSFYVVGPGSP
ncbi:MAG TPA: PilX N-terminal domain-containing pilus assembly protein [Gammaproteobacteria bacterium]|nr:PilX N-terminal domain-containing pilus assembly protein [Gammaproteobacteria bacterium]